MKLPMVLGLDSSTQSLSAVVVDSRDASTVCALSVQYKTDPRLSGFGLDPELLLLPPRSSGEADQPPLLFLASLEALFADLKGAGVDLAQIGLISVSAQQHGHVYLGAGFSEVLEQIRAGKGVERPLAQVLAGAFSYPRAPIWKTSNTASEAESLRQSAGGSADMITLTGSDSPLRFTGAVARHVFLSQPEVWEATVLVHLLSSFIPAVLTGNPNVATDWEMGAALAS